MNSHTFERNPQTQMHRLHSYFACNQRFESEESLHFARLSYHSSAFCIRWLPFTAPKERITKLSEEVLQRPSHCNNNNNRNSPCRRRSLALGPMINLCDLCPTMLEPCSICGLAFPCWCTQVSCCICSSLHFSCCLRFQILQASGI